MSWRRKTAHLRGERKQRDRKGQGHSFKGPPRELLPGCSVPSQAFSSLLTCAASLPPQVPSAPPPFLAMPAVVTARLYVPMWPNKFHFLIKCSFACTSIQISFFILASLVYSKLHIGVYLGLGCSSVIECQPRTHDALGSIPWSGTMKEENEYVGVWMSSDARTDPHTCESQHCQDNEFNFCALPTSFLSYLQSISSLLYPHTGLHLCGMQTSGVYLFQLLSILVNT